MPLEHKEPRSNVPAIAAGDFEKGLTATFTDEGRDIEAPQGLMYMYIVLVDNQEKGLWIKPGSARAIALAPHVPLQGKTLKISKTGTGKATRYIVEEPKTQKHK